MNNPVSLSGERDFLFSPKFDRLDLFWIEICDF